MEASQVSPSQIAVTPTHPLLLVAAAQPSICNECGVVEIRESKRYEVVVRFEDDSRRSFGSETPPAWQSGDRVRLQNGLLTMGGGRPNGNPATI